MLQFVGYLYVTMLQLLTSYVSEYLTRQRFVSTDLILHLVLNKARRTLIILGEKLFQQTKEIIHKETILKSS